MSKAIDRQTLRDLILIALHQSRPTGYGAEVLRSTLRGEGIVLGSEETAQELDYLAGKGLIRSQASALSAANVRWHLTSEGVDYLEGQDLA